MFERPRGTRDFKPEDNVRRRYLESIVREVSGLFGYGEVVTPTFEHAELFIAKSGPGVLAELYEFKDKSGRHLALRPELTAPVIRFYLNELTKRPKPLKVYYVGNCFRYEEPQKGKYREFWQYGVEILGGNPLDADAEVIATALEVFRRGGLGQGLELRIGDIGILRGLITAPADAKAKILHQLDKKDFEGLKRELRAAELGGLEPTMRKLVAVRGGPEALDRARKLLKDETSLAAVDYLGELGGLLASHGTGAVTYDLGVVRGLDYYTGMVFEVHYPALGAASQLCGGGSYALAEIFGGEPITTTGFGMGFDRLQLAREAQGVSFPSERLVAFIVPIGDQVRPRAVEIARELRRGGVPTDLDLVRRGPSKNLDYANARGAKYAVIVAERELAHGAVGLRDLASGHQEEVPVGELVARLKRP